MGLLGGVPMRSYKEESQGEVTSTSNNEWFQGGVTMRGYKKGFKDEFQ